MVARGVVNASEVRGGLADHNVEAATEVKKVFVEILAQLFV